MVSISVVVASQYPTICIIFLLDFILMKINCNRTMKKEINELTDEIKKYMSDLGKRGKGDKKRRGDSEYYRRLANMRKKIVKKL
jgi:hypothetical protein